MFDEDLPHARQAGHVTIPLHGSDRPREGRLGPVIVEIEELLVGQLVVVVLTLRPLIEFAANGIDTVVDPFAVIADREHRLE